MQEKKRRGWGVIQYVCHTRALSLLSERSNKRRQSDQKLHTSETRVPERGRERKKNRTSLQGRNSIKSRREIRMRAEGINSKESSSKPSFTNCVPFRPKWFIPVWCRSSRQLQSNQRRSSLPEPPPPPSFIFAELSLLFSFSFFLLFFSKFHLHLLEVSGKDLLGFNLMTMAHFPASEGINFKTEQDFTPLRRTKDARVTFYLFLWLSDCLSYTLVFYGTKNNKINIKNREWPNVFFTLKNFWINSGK